MLRSSRLALSLLALAMLCLCAAAAVAQTTPGGAMQEYKVYLYSMKNSEPSRELLDGPTFDQRKREEVEKWVKIYTDFLQGNFTAHISDPDHPFTANEAQSALNLDPTLQQRLQQNPIKLAEMAQTMGEWAFFYDQLAAWQGFVETKVLQAPLAENEKPSYVPADAGKLNDTYKAIQEKAKAVDAEEFKRYMKMVGAIDKDRTNQEVYEDWLKQEEQDLQGFAEKWGRQYDGTEFEVEGTLYLVRNYKEAPPSSEDDVLKESLPRNAVLLEVSRGREVTPYDIINPNGTLRKPAGQ